MRTDPLIHEQELDAALRQTLMRAAPAELAGDIRIAVAREAARENRSRARRRRVLIMPELRLAMVGMIVGIWLARGPRAATPSLVRPAEGTRRFVVAGVATNSIKVTRRVRPSQSEVMDMPPSAHWSSVSRQPASDNEARLATWIEEPGAPAASANTEVRNAGNTTNRMNVNDELRNERTTYAVTREWRDGKLAQVDVRFEKSPMYESPKEEKQNESSQLPVNHPANGRAVAGADRVAAKATAT